MKKHYFFFCCSPLFFSSHFFYCCSSTVVSISPPSLPPTPDIPTSHPWSCPSLVLSCVLYTCFWKTLPPFPSIIPSHLRSGYCQFVLNFNVSGYILWKSITFKGTKITESESSFIPREETKLRMSTWLQILVIGSRLSFILSFMKLAI